MRSKAAPHAGVHRGRAQLRASGRYRPAPTARRTADDAKQRADRELEPGAQPRLQLLPGPVIHADLAASAALAAAHQHGKQQRIKDVWSRHLPGPGVRVPMDADYDSTDVWMF